MEQLEQRCGIRREGPNRDSIMTMASFQIHPSQLTHGNKRGREREMLLFGKQCKLKIVNSMVFNPYPRRDVHIGEMEGPLDELLKCTGFQVRVHGGQGEWEPRKGSSHFLENEFLIRGLQSNWGWRISEDGNFSSFFGEEKLYESQRAMGTWGGRRCVTSWLALRIVLKAPSIHFFKM